MTVNMTTRPRPADLEMLPSGALRLPPHRIAHIINAGYGSSTRIGRLIGAGARYDFPG